MTNATKSRATIAGESDGSTAALLKDCRDYSDDFIRRRELGEDERADYKAAWHAAHDATSRMFRVGRYAGMPINPEAEAECRRIVARQMAAVRRG